MKKIYLFMVVLGCYSIQSQLIQNDSNKQTRGKQSTRKRYNECSECGQLFESKKALRLHAMIGPYQIGCTGKRQRMIIFNDSPVRPLAVPIHRYRPDDEDMTDKAELAG